MKSILLLCVLGVGLSASSVKKGPTHRDVTFFLESYLSDNYAEYGIKNLLFVSIKYQRLYLVRYNQVLKEYAVSTSKYGVGNHQHTRKTPTGLHFVEQKLGSDVPINGILKAGVYQGEEAAVVSKPIETGQDLVTTRILWLKGLEKGRNLGGKVDSYDRKIYIHGTPEEGLIGKRASHGCIRMKNSEVLELFDLAERGIYVLILDV